MFKPVIIRKFKSMKAPLIEPVKLIETFNFPNVSRVLRFVRDSHKWGEGASTLYQKGALKLVLDDGLNTLYNSMTI